MAEREERQQQVAQDYELRYRSLEYCFYASVPFLCMEPKLGRVKSCGLHRLVLFYIGLSSFQNFQCLTFHSGSPYSPSLCFLKGYLCQLSHLFFRLAREQARVRDLQSRNQQLEEQRAELVEQLQAMLQAHWEEANRLLSTSALPPNPPVGITPLS